MALPVAHGGKVHVCAEMCATCVFRPGNLMKLKPGRLRRMVDQALKDDGQITCHSTIYEQAEQEAVCRGFYDRHADSVWPLRLARAMDRIQEV
jgi:hypothetical protein